MNITNQTVTGNNNTTVQNVAGRDIKSDINISKEESASITEQLEELRDLISKCGMSSSEISDAVDDVDALQEQIENKEPKINRIKSTIKRLLVFSKDIPQAIIIVNEFAKRIPMLVETIHTSLLPFLK